jgi:ABC transport system ATP-binding/permease protein
MGQPSTVIGGYRQDWSDFFTFPNPAEEREWASMEANILSAENEVSDLEATFAAPDFYAKPRSEIFELETQLKTARDKVAHLYARWHELELLQSVPSP